MGKQLSLFSGSRHRTRRTRLEQEFAHELRNVDMLCTLATLEGIASQAHREAGTTRYPGPAPERIAHAAGLRVRIGNPRGTGGAALCNGVIVYSARMPDATRATALWHELAHHLLRSIEHTHKDVWILSLLLVFPREHLALTRTEGWTVRTLHSYQPHAERWMLRERAWMARQLSRNAA